MANTSRDRYPEIYSHPAAGLSNEARLRRIYADIEDEYDLQHNIEPRDPQGAPAEHLEWYGIELTPMLFAVLLCVPFALWHLWAALY